jgi:hypothetical protein
MSSIFFCDEELIRRPFRSGPGSPGRGIGAPFAIEGRVGQVIGSVVDFQFQPATKEVGPMAICMPAGRVRLQISFSATVPGGILLRALPLSGADLGERDNRLAAIPFLRRHGGNGQLLESLLQPALDLVAPVPFNRKADHLIP